MFHYTYVAPKIAKKNCINTDKPKLNCNGKCYIAKQIKAAENNDNDSYSRLVIPDQDFYYEGTYNYSHFKLFKTVVFSYYSKTLCGFVSSIVKPPAS